MKTALPQEGAIYHRFSHWYERFFERVFGPRVRGAIQSLHIPPGAKVLEVGVGTGISLAAYPPGADVTAIDLSSEMLAQSQRKIDEHGWTHITLRQMDALNLEFEDGEFDYVTAFHIASVVPDAERLMSEITRVLKPGGTVVVINHFRSEKRWLAPLTDMLNPLTQRIGWRTTLRFDELVEHAPIQVEGRFKTSPRSLFTIVVARKPSTGC
jgi:phosphatidylethanolamine/phosphatidyl-N-methylethanolamine N-methyltransferase